MSLFVNHLINLNVILHIHDQLSAYWVLFIIVYYYKCFHRFFCNIYKQLFLILAYDFIKKQNNYQFHVCVANSGESKVCLGQIFTPKQLKSNCSDPPKRKIRRTTGKEREYVSMHIKHRKTSNRTFLTLS